MILFQWPLIAVLWTLERLDCLLNGHFAVRNKHSGSLECLRCGKKVERYL